jgi:hypothetical protein
LAINSRPSFAVSIQPTLCTGSDSRWRSSVCFLDSDTLASSLEPGVILSAAEDVEMEDLNFYYANYSRIYNDVITLRKGSSYM